MKQSPKIAFSLIELSVVILVIGILVIGITQGSRIIREAKLKSARALTNSSPVASIPNLTFWIESTSEKSLDSAERVDTAIGAQGTITNWYDINQGTTIINNPTQGTSANKPRYIANAINGLPAVNFDGTDDNMAFDPSILGINGKDWTVYSVTQLRTGVLAGYNFISSTTNTGFAIGYNGNGVSIHCQINGSLTGCGPGISLYSVPKPVLHMFSYKPWAGNQPYYIFGRGNNNGSSGAITLGVPLNMTSMTIGSKGAASFFNGDIAEIIIFNRALKDSENTTIREYLKTKWAIK